MSLKISGHSRKVLERFSSLVAEYYFHHTTEPLNYYEDIQHEAVMFDDIIEILKSDSTVAEKVAIAIAEKRNEREKAEMD